MSVLDSSLYLIKKICNQITGSTFKCCSVSYYSIQCNADGLHVDTGKFPAAWLKIIIMMIIQWICLVNSSWDNDSHCGKFCCVCLWCFSLKINFLCCSRLRCLDVWCRAEGPFGLLIVSICSWHSADATTDLAAPRGNSQHYQFKTRKMICGRWD